MFKTDPAPRPLMTPVTDTVADMSSFVAETATGVAATGSPPNPAEDQPAHGVYTTAQLSPVKNGGQPEQWESATRRAHRLRMKEYFSRAYRPI